MRRCGLVLRGLALNERGSMDSDVGCGCLTLVLALAGLAWAFGEDQDPAVRVVGILVLIASIAIPKAYWDRGQARIMSEVAARAQAQRVAADYSAAVQQRLRAAVGPGRVVAVCSEHSRLLTPTVCLLSARDDVLEITALKVQPDHGLLDQLCDGRCLEAPTTLQFVIAFNDVVRFGKKAAAELGPHRPGVDDRLERAIIGGLIAGAPGAVVGALTGQRVAPAADVLSAGHRGGVYDRVAPDREWVIQTADGEWLVVCGSDGDLQHAYNVAPWRAVVDGFNTDLRAAIVQKRMG